MNTLKINLSNFYKQYLWVLLVCTVATLLAFAGHYRFTNLGFDAQTILTWDYAARAGYLPYKDTFYPYGILQYYYESSLFAQYTLLVLCSFYFFFAYISFKRLTRNTVVSCLLLLSYFLFVVRLTGFQPFVRYGCSVTYALIAATVFAQKTALSKKQIALLGMGVGLCTALFLDQGFYAYVVFLALFSLRYLQQKNKKGFFVLLVNFGGGLILGAAPLFIYLFSTNSLIPFYKTLLHLPQLTEYAKTPFFSSIEKSENIFLLLTLLFSLIKLAYQLFIEEKKYEYEHYIQLGVTIALGLVMYKNTVRLIDREITFIAFLVLVVILLGLKNEFNKWFIREKFFYWYIVVFSLYIVFQPFFAVVHFRERVFVSESINEQIQHLSDEESGYESVVNKLKEDPSFSGKVFSFPTDPIFYPLFNQKPPRYLQIYDGSPEAAQRETISYIHDSRINTIIYNLSVHALQDSVPDYLRANTLLKYIIINFEPAYTVGNFLILHKSVSPNFFQSKATPAALQHELLHPNFGMIPISEGRHKSHLFENLEPLAIGTAGSLSQKLSENFQAGSAIVLTADCMNDAVATVLFTTVEGIQTTVSFDCRVTEPIILKLERVPLFFYPYTLKEVAYSKNLTDMALYKNSKDIEKLW